MPSPKFPEPLINTHPSNRSLYSGDNKTREWQLTPKTNPIASCKSFHFPLHHRVLRTWGPIAQLVEHLTFNQVVASSNLAGLTIFPP